MANHAGTYVLRHRVHLGGRFFEAGESVALSAEDADRAMANGTVLLPSVAVDTKSDAAIGLTTEAPPAAAATSESTSSTPPPAADASPTPTKAEKKK